MIRSPASPRVVIGAVRTRMERDQMMYSLACREANDSDHREDLMIYEYRAYYVMPGRMADLQRRFHDVTMGLFKKHNIQVVGFWETGIGESNELVYICAYDDFVHRERAWKAFMRDPQRQAARRAGAGKGPAGQRVGRKV